MGIKFFRYIPSFIWFVLILIASFMPSQHIQSEWIMFSNEDKLIHAGMYFGLTFLFLFDSKRSFIPSMKFVCITIFCSICMSGLIEFLQPSVSNRTADFADLIANSVGAILGGLCILPLIRKKA